MGCFTQSLWGIAPCNARFVGARHALSSWLSKITQNALDPRNAGVA